jgi:hypothetical protein
MGKNLELREGEGLQKGVNSHHLVQRVTSSVSFAPSVHPIARFERYRRRSWIWLTWKSLEWRWSEYLAVLIAALSVVAPLDNSGVEEQPTKSSRRTSPFKGSRPNTRLEGSRKLGRKRI